MMKYLPIAFILALEMLICGNGLLAQTVRSDRKETLQQQKMVFFNEKLQLTQAESAKFWPVYNDYQNRRDRITRDRNTLLQYYEANLGNMTDTEAGGLIQKYVAFQKEETILLESYTDRFTKILPAAKVMQLFVVELDFKKWLLENLRQNKVQSSSRN